MNCVPITLKPPVTVERSTGSTPGEAEAVAVAVSVAVPELTVAVVAPVPPVAVSDELSVGVALEDGQKLS